MSVFRQSKEKDAQEEEREEEEREEEKRKRRGRRMEMETKRKKEGKKERTAGDGEDRKTQFKREQKKYWKDVFKRAGRRRRVFMIERKKRCVDFQTRAWSRKKEKDWKI